jgi:CBS-domain-containing membrane protein
MNRFFYRHQAAPKMRIVVLAGLGAAISIGVLGLLTEMSSTAMLMAPFGASCVLKFAVPSSPLSQPANVVGGHLISALVGLLLHFIMPGNVAVAGLAVGLAVMGMMLLRVVHPPAGATALVGYSVATSWTFLLFPVLAGSVLLVLIAGLFHKFNGTVYPLPRP